MQHEGLVALEEPGALARPLGSGQTELLFGAARAEPLVPRRPLGAERYEVRPREMHRGARAALKLRRFVPLVLDAPLQLGVPGLQQLDGGAVLRQQGIEGGLRRPAGEADAQPVGLRGQGEGLASAEVAVVDPLVNHTRGGEVRGHLQVVDDEVDERPEGVPLLDGSRVSERAEEALAEVGELSERIRHAVPIFRLRRLVDRALAAG